MKEFISCEDLQNFSAAFDLDPRSQVAMDAVVENGIETPDRWRVENSWGDDHGDKGYFTMSDEWFSEFVYQILLNRKYFTAEESAQFDAKPIELKPWDPMGSLAF